MSSGTATVRRTSAWAIIAAMILFVLGVAFIVLGADLAMRGLAKGPDSGGVREALVGVGIAAVAIGSLHVLASAWIAAHRSRGRALGLVIAVIGTLLGAIVFAIALRGALDPNPGSGTPVLTGLLFPVPHLAVLIGLVLGPRHFTAASPSEREP
jgi:hypothetical protein